MVLAWVVFVGFATFTFWSLALWADIWGLKRLVEAVDVQGMLEDIERHGREISRLEKLVETRAERFISEEISKNLSLCLVSVGEQELKIEALQRQCKALEEAYNALPTEPGVVTLDDLRLQLKKAEEDRVRIRVALHDMGLVLNHYEKQETSSVSSKLVVSPDADAEEYQC